LRLKKNFARFKRDLKWYLVSLITWKRNNAE
jgi:hypothetical protein